MKQRIYSFLLLVMALLCMGTTTAQAEAGFWSEGACAISLWTGGESDVWYQSNSSGAEPVVIEGNTSMYLKGFWFKMWENTDVITSDAPAYMYYYVTKRTERDDANATWKFVFVGYNYQYREFSGWNNGTQNVTFKNLIQNVNLADGLEAGEYSLVYYFKYGNDMYLSNNSQNYVVNFEVPQDDNVKALGDIAAGADASFEFTADEDAVYTFTANYSDATVLVYPKGTSQSGVSDVGSLLVGLSKKLTCVVKVTNNTEQSMSSVKVTIAKQSYPTLALGQNTLADLAASDQVFCTFTPTETGYYTFNTSNQNILLVLGYSESDGNVTMLGNGWGLFGSELTAGTTYVLSLLNTTESAISNLTVGVAKVDVQSLSIGRNGNLALPALVGYAPFASFTPAEDGDYKFVIDQSSATYQIRISPTLCVTSDTKGVAVAKNLVKDQTYYIFMLSEVATTVSVTLSKEGTSVFTYTATSDLSSKFQSAFSSVGTVTCGTWTDATTPVAVIVAGKVTSIGASAFRQCETLTSIEIPEGVTTIGEDAFWWCHSLTAINIPDGVTTIGRYAFEYCDNANTISIPSSVTSIGESAFARCYLTDGSLTNESSIDLTQKGLNFVEQKQADGLCIVGNEATHCRRLATSVTIPSGITSIRQYAFGFCKDLTSVTIPEGVTTIGNNAFIECFALPSVVLPSSVQSIGDYAFVRDYLLASCTFQSIPQMGSDVFVGAGQNCSDGCKYSLALNDKSYIAPENGSVEALTSAPTYSRAMSNEWGTLVVPFEAVSDGEVQLYELSGVSSNALTFAPVETVAANTPCVFQKKDASATSVTVTASGTAVAAAAPATPGAVGGLAIRGTYTQLTDQTGIYFIARDQFWLADNAITIAPYRAWFEGTLPSASQCAGLRIEVAGDAESITSVSSDEVGATSRFDLQGRHIAEPRTGLQIRDGRVILVK